MLTSWAGEGGSILFILIPCIDPSSARFNFSEFLNRPPPLLALFIAHFCPPPIIRNLSINCLQRPNKYLNRSFHPYKPLLVNKMSQNLLIYMKKLKELTSGSFFPLISTFSIKELYKCITQDTLILH